MGTLFNLCQPRESVFDETKRDDVLDLTDLIENRINPASFFEENYLTQGMEVLFDTAFKRFHRQGATGLVKLTQSMGGGKTHNMIALGLIAKHPEYREKVIGDKFKNSYVGKVKVIAFTGRESDAPYGIWGAIADQLGKKELFRDYYTPLRAPGQKAWINLLKGEPLLILLDELPPYLENAKSVSVGDSNLAVVTTNALANLFNALGKEELSNVCLVISDLKATYESGSELLQSTFKELEDEITRFALNLEPVASASDEVYHILKKRLFKELPPETEINEIAKGYQQAVLEARQMGYTNMSPDQIYLGVKDSYPFHPSIKDLYARFKENLGFQQTRGLIRLMRLIVTQLYQGEEPKAKNKYLINVHDFDLNDSEMLTAITHIKPSLTNAIAHDISSNGKAIAEVVDAQMNETTMQELSKLILVASLADVPNALLGLSLSETIGYLCEPGKDISSVKRALDEFVMQAWYLYTDRDGRLFFKNTKNMIAELNSLVDSYDNENAKIELREFLDQKFKPSVLDCYQSITVFPAIDEITLTEDKVLLVLFEPYKRGSEFQPALLEFYENAVYKNRVMFLSGQKDTMDKLYQSAKQHKAINVIIDRMKEENVAPSNPQFQKAEQKLSKVKLELLQTARETFSTLYYPSRDELAKADFFMEFSDNNYNGENQIRELLLQRQKFTKDITSDIFRKKCEDRLFTQKEMRWIDVKRRAATNPVWQWHIPRALDDLKDEMLKNDIWRESGGYIEKPPFPKPKTGVLVQELRWDDNTGEAILKLTPKFGDRIYYEVGAPATAASTLVENVNEFRTKELKLSFLCVDSTGEHETGEPYKWQNKISLKYQVYDQGENKVVVLEAFPAAQIKYTTDGSNPKEHGGIYHSEFVVPKDTTYVLAVAEADGIFSDVLTFKIDQAKDFTVDKSKPLTLFKKQKTNDTSETYKELALLKKHQVQISDVFITFYKIKESNIDKSWIELTLDSSTRVEIERLEDSMDNIRNNFMSEGRINISVEYNVAVFASGQNFLDWVAEKKMELKEFAEQEIVQ